MNNNNQITNTGISYDPVGNNTADGSYSYTYDAENRIVSASGMSGGPYCYTYDGNGTRVAKAHGASCTSAPPIDVLYWRSLSGDTLAETDSSGSTSNASYHEYIIFGGRRIARSDVSTGNIFFLFADHLGSTRAMTQANGTVCFLSEYYPYGLELNTTSSCTTNYKFTGYERDAETGIDYAFARYYNPRLGRFMSGDPLSGDISDPQTLNRYTYSRNNPINLMDPSGLDSIDPNFCEASMSSCGGDNGGPLGGPGSFVRKTWNDAMAQYLQQVYNSSISIGPDGNIYRPSELRCSRVALSGASQNCIGIPGFQVGQSADGDSSWAWMHTFWAFMNGYWNKVPFTLTIYYPIVQTRGIVQVQVPISVLPKQGVGCVGGGLALGSPSGKYVSAGPLLFGDLNSAQSVLSGWSWNINAQTSPLIGYQGMLNGSGQVNGPTVATATGFTVGGSGSLCGSIK